MDGQGKSTMDVQGKSTRESTFEEKCSELRGKTKSLEDYARLIMKDSRFDHEQKFPNQHGEMKANIMIAIRHFEDARMRFGKVLQYDGVSILDK